MITRLFLFTGLNIVKLFFLLRIIVDITYSWINKLLKTIKNFHNKLY